MRSFFTPSTWRGDEIPKRANGDTHTTSRQCYDTLSSTVVSFLLSPSASLHYKGRDSWLKAGVLFSIIIFLCVDKYFLLLLKFISSTLPGHPCCCSDC